MVVISKASHSVSRTMPCRLIVFISHGTLYVVVYIQSPSIHVPILDLQGSHVYAVTKLDLQWKSIRKFGKLEKEHLVLHC